MADLQEMEYEEESSSEESSEESSSEESSSSSSSGSSSSSAEDDDGGDPRPTPSQVADADEEGDEPVERRKRKDAPSTPLPLIGKNKRRKLARGYSKSAPNLSVSPKLAAAASVSPITTTPQTPPNVERPADLSRSESGDGFDISFLNEMGLHDSDGNPILIKRHQNGHLVIDARKGDNSDLIGRDSPGASPSAKKRKTRTSTTPDFFEDRAGVRSVPSKKKKEEMSCKEFLTLIKNFFEGNPPPSQDDGFKWVTYLSRLKKVTERVPDGPHMGQELNNLLIGKNVETIETHTVMSIEHLLSALAEIHGGGADTSGDDIDLYEFTAEKSLPTHFVRFKALVSSLHGEDAMEKAEWRNETVKRIKRSPYRDAWQRTMLTLSPNSVERDPLLLLCRRAQNLFELDNKKKKSTPFYGISKSSSSYKKAEKELRDATCDVCLGNDHEESECSIVKTFRKKNPDFHYDFADGRKECAFHGRGRHSTKECVYRERIVADPSKFLSLPPYIKTMKNKEKRRAKAAAKAAARADNAGDSKEINFEEFKQFKEFKAFLKSKNE